MKQLLIHSLSYSNTSLWCLICLLHSSRSTLQSFIHITKRNINMVWWLDYNYLRIPYNLKSTALSLTQSGGCGILGHALLPVGLGHLCMLIMWQKTEADREILKCMGMYCLLWFSQMQPKWLDDQECALKESQEYVLWPNQSPDLKQIKHALKTQQLKTAALKVWQSITRKPKRLGLRSQLVAWIYDEPMIHKYIFNRFLQILNNLSC